MSASKPVDYKSAETLTGLAVVSQQEARDYLAEANAGPGVDPAQRDTLLRAWWRTQIEMATAFPNLAAHLQRIEQVIREEKVRAIEARDEAEAMRRAKAKST